MLVIKTTSLLIIEEAAVIAANFPMENDTIQFSYIDDCVKFRALF
jgi:hypothetical protein